MSTGLKKELDNLSSKHKELMKDQKKLKDVKQVESRKPKWASKCAEHEGKLKPQIKLTPLNQRRGERNRSRHKQYE